MVIRSDVVGFIDWLGNLTMRTENATRFIQMIDSGLSIASIDGHHACAVVNVA